VNADWLASKRAAYCVQANGMLLFLFGCSLHYLFTGSIAHNAGI